MITKQRAKTVTGKPVAMLNKTCKNKKLNPNSLNKSRVYERMAGE